MHPAIIVIGYLFIAFLANRGIRIYEKIQDAKRKQMGGYYEKYRVFRDRDLYAILPLIWPVSGVIGLVSLALDHIVFPVFEFIVGLEDKFVHAVTKPKIKKQNKEETPSFLS